MQVLPFHQGRIKWPGDKTHLGQLLLQGRQLRRRITGICHGNAGSTGAYAPAGHGQARSAQAENQNILAQQGLERRIGLRHLWCVFCRGLGRRILGLERFVRLRSLFGLGLGKDLCHKGCSICGSGQGGGLGAIRFCGWYSRGLGELHRPDFFHGVRHAQLHRTFGHRRWRFVVDGRIFRIHRSLRVDRPTRHSNMVMIQKRTTTCVSFQPFFSKWWCSGAILNRRRPSP